MGNILSRLGNIFKSRVPPNKIREMILALEVQESRSKNDDTEDWRKFNEMRPYMEDNIAKRREAQLFKQQKVTRRYTKRLGDLRAIELEYMRNGLL